ncbi:MAG: DUF2442 domain-containing protein [Ruminococcaceae bacterium]|nr:DUF2442 domain-containing protein [Oscillospiraceae bacterium]
MNKSIEYYLSKGFDKKSAEYFSSGRKRVVSVVPNVDFTLTLGFDNGEKRLYDVSPLIKSGTVFECIMKIEDFCRVYIDSTHSIAWDIDPTIDSEKVWSNKVDLSSDTCYMDSVPIC